MNKKAWAYAAAIAWLNLAMLATYAGCEGKQGKDNCGCSPCNCRKCDCGEVPRPVIDVDINREQK
jgi:hypothetical protein